MSCLVWNVRGLGSPRAFQELQRLVEDRKPSLVFLCEMKVSESVCLRWKTILGFCGGFAVSCCGKSRGLVLLWKQELKITIKSYSKGHIDCLVVDGDKIWRFTGFYGNPDASLRRFSWDLLRRLKLDLEMSCIPWLVGGDFNEICFASEKYGGRIRSETQMEAFRNILEECELRNIHCEREYFTWVNKRKSDSLIFEKLDRFVCSFSWGQLYPTAKATSLEFFHSDHRPIEIKLGPKENSTRISGSKKIFHFEMCWLEEENFDKVVEEGWSLVSPSASLQTRIKTCVEVIENWAGTSFKKFSKQIAEKRRNLTP